MKTELVAHYRTGGQAAQDVADVQMHSRSDFWSAWQAGGPLDAPIAVPSGSCNSTDVRGGPWHLNDGAGRFLPAESWAPRG